MPTSANRGEMPYRILGRTGERVSAIGLGGWHLGLKNVDEELSVRIVRHAVDRGINFLDNSWDYNDGASEIRMGKALLDGYRNKVFLMTKIDGRSKAEAKRQLDESLRRLGTDRLDLVQHHEIIRYEDPHRIFDEEGAHGALVEARQRIGVLGMKSMANGIILKSGTVTAIECLHYALGLPTSVVITGIESMERLEQAFEAARTFRPMDAAQRSALLAKTKIAASRGEFELFKTTSIFDSTATNPAWLGEEPERVQQLMPQ